MSDNKSQMKLTQDEIENQISSLCLRLASIVDGTNDPIEDTFDRLSYFAKRLIKIQKGEPEIETEQTEAAPAKGWN